jgi:hypothetical protein
MEPGGGGGGLRASVGLNMRSQLLVDYLRALPALAVPLATRNSADTLSDT